MRHITELLVEISSSEWVWIKKKHLHVYESISLWLCSVKLLLGRPKTPTGMILLEELKT